ncbi:MAG: PolC-type DNA polymerase III, partial [Emergencia sp.]|nr:PolC-type DNA polymerase III [Emergencia sp.]
RYDNCLVVMLKDINKGKMKKRQDTYEGGKRVELHAHTKMSSMDGLNDVANLVKTAAAWGQPAVAVTDHGVVQSFPDAAKTAKKLASDKENPVHIKIIYGMEGYVFDDRDCHNEDGTIDFKKKNTNHIILLAATQEGLKNIYKLVSYSHLEYFYKRPRLPWSVIEAHREGIIIGSACEAGEVYRAVAAGKSREEIEEIASRYDYLEIQPLINNRFMIEQGMVSGEEELREHNRQIVALADRLGKPVVATTDAHYDEPESAVYRNILMAGMGFKDAENGQGLYMRTTDEMMEEFSYLGEETARRVVIENTNQIADMIDGNILPVPKGKFPPKIPGAEETLRKTCMEKAHSIYGEPLPEKIGARLEKELSSIIDNGYAVMYVSAQMLVHKSMEDGYLVGSRGSVGSSFAATMAGITEVNPLEPHYICPNCKKLIWGDMQTYDCGIDMPELDCPECGTPMHRDGYTIPFATFLGFDGDKEPDIDLNFAGEYQATAHKYVGEIFGEKNVFKAGTVGTVADKTAYGYVMKFADEFNRPINKFEADRLTQGCTGVKRTTGQHPGGIIIVPDDHEIYEFCPVQHPANDVKSDIITTHFDYHKIDENLLKLDILGHNIPSMIRQLQDMTGIDPMKADLTDRKVLSIFNGIEALDIKNPDYKYTHGSYAIPEFGTSFVRQMLDDTKPDKFADLVRISGFSHGTDVWLNNAQDYIRSGTATMREVISTRDDIMNYLILKGIENKTSFQIMEDV